MSSPNAVRNQVILIAGLSVAVLIMAITASVAIFQIPSADFDFLNTAQIRVSLAGAILLLLVAIAIQLYKFFHLPRTRRVILQVLAVLVAWGTIQTASPFGLMSFKDAALKMKLQSKEISHDLFEAEFKAAWDKATNQSSAIYAITVLGLCLLVFLYALVAIIEAERKLTV